MPELGPDVEQLNIELPSMCNLLGNVAEASRHAINWKRYSAQCLYDNTTSNSSVVFYIHLLVKYVIYKGIHARQA